MDIKEAQLTKAELEGKIAKLLTQFSYDTGTVVDNISISSVMRLDGKSVRYIPQITARL